jgi:UDP-3-O-[3-hydroxymyristoyl] glucosamine N-acyltransferase
VISRATKGISHNKVNLEIEIFSKITAGHKIDCMRNVSIGDYSIFVGANTQVWTHRYVHERTGTGRFRVDGEIIIGNNVYIGSRCVFNLGVRIADGVTLGSNSTISKSITKLGLYVSHPLRYVDYDVIRNRLNKNYL